MIGPQSFAFKFLIHQSFYYATLYSLAKRQELSRTLDKLSALAELVETPEMLNIITQKNCALKVLH
jgi:hypothetical protein